MGYKISFRDDTQISASEINTALQQIAGTNYTNVVLSDNTDYDVTDLNEIRKDIISGGLIGYPDIYITQYSIKICNAVIIAKNGVRVEFDSEGVEFQVNTVTNSTIQYIYLYCFDKNYAVGLIVSDTEKTSENFTLVMTVKNNGYEYGPQASLKLTNPQFSPSEQTESFIIDDEYKTLITPNNPNWKRFFVDIENNNFFGYFDRERNKLFCNYGMFNIFREENEYSVQCLNFIFFVKITEDSKITIKKTNLPDVRPRCSVTLI